MMGPNESDQDETETLSDQSLLLYWCTIAFLCAVLVLLTTMTTLTNASVQPAEQFVQVMKTLLTGC